MELADILSEDSVIVCSESKTKLDVLHRLAEQAAKITGQDAATIFEAVNDREQLGSTGLGNGIAIPHGKFAGLNGVTALFAKLDTPVEFEAVDDQPVDLVMLLLAPMGAGADHLKALARVARILRTDSVVARLRRSGDADELYGILTQPLEATRAA
ncbi:MAG TPA: PTS sugar transporter subunit IIA [Devosia sp.]|jgi:PTS system nitrogen regulatory IIA component|uniref:PTS sugar transporter subunit IIA n=1 Tax=Devosia sp. TaxID=1871048 RepID=UPI002DDD805D|nr:PTS sugar transporter subunit IIA [Devosia sp.]HEV2513979.1 PTS sugar transporter subunit IIA [Devosia sp.]